MKYFPTFYDLTDQTVLVIGAGAVASRKVDLLLRAKAKVTIVAKEISDEIINHRKRERIVILQRSFESTDLELDCFSLVIVATNDKACNKKASELAKAKYLPVNVVDDRRLSNFIVPSIVDRSPVVIAISSSATSPVLARWLRSKIEQLLPAQLGKLAVLMEELRQKMKRSSLGVRARQQIQEKLLDSPLAEWVYKNEIDKARQYFHRRFENPEENKADQSENGVVYLIGAGPGDPELLTLKAHRLLQQADVVLYDRLVSPEVVDLARRDCEKIYVGKKRDFHSILQEDLNKLLVDLARSGKRVARLKGGDPFIFGRGGEEIEKLCAHNISFTVVPGVSAANGCAAYAGIPLTHRDYAQSVSFVTAHLRNGELNLKWQNLIQDQHTLVIYMGLISLPILADKLLSRGAAASLPLAVISKGTTGGQLTHISTLGNVKKLMKEEVLLSPALIILGEVVKFRSKFKQKNYL